MRTAIAAFLAIAAFFYLNADSKSINTDQLAEKARSGDTASQYDLALEYFFGRNRTVNPVLALYWFRRAADAGHVESQYNAARCFERGWGCRRSMGMALNYYIKAKENNLPEAKLRYAELLYLGHPAEENEFGKFPALKADKFAALELMRETAKTSDAAKLTLIKHLFMDAPQHGQELRSRLKHYAATPSPHPEMLLLYSSCLRSGIGGEVDIQTGTAILKRAADAGNLEALAQLAEAMELGIGVPYDPQEALKLTQLAAKKGNQRAMVNLGNAHLTGINIKYAPDKAVEYFQKAAKSGYPPALRKLGECYSRGIGVEPDWKTAVDHYRSAASGGDEEACFLLGDCYEKGFGVTKNAAQAFYYYSQAADRGSIKAIRKMAIFLLDGHGVLQDTKRGMLMLRQAAAAGDQTAQFILKQKAE